MPAEKRVGFEDAERLFPVLAAACKEDEPEAIGLREGGVFDLRCRTINCCRSKAFWAMRLALLRVRSVTMLRTIEWREG